MIKRTEYVLFEKDRQREFLMRVKFKLNCTWNDLICSTQISKAMFYNYLRELHPIRKDVFCSLSAKANIEISDESFEILTINKNFAEIPERDLPEFAEFIGILLGDGHISGYKHQIIVSLNSILEREYLVHVKNMMTHLFNAEPHIRYLKTENGMQINFNSKLIHHFLHETIGLPDGKRIYQPTNAIPDYLFEDPHLLQACLRGLFDTEGSLSTRHHKAIRLSIYNNSDPLLNSIYLAFQNLEYHPIKKMRSVRLNRTAEIIRFFNEIGSHNPYKCRRYVKWLKTGKLDNVHTAVL